jgi:peroxiredoxin
VGFRAPEIELVSIGGNTYRLSDYAGQPVVVNFWATWCPPCVAEIPEIQAAYSEYDFYLMAVNVGEDSGTTLQFAREMNMTFPVLLDTYGRVSNAYDVSSIPITFFIDAEGVIRQIERGSMSADVLYTDLQTIGVVP